MAALLPALLRKRYKYIQCISFVGFSVLYLTRLASCIVCSQLTSQPVSHVSSTSLVHLSWMPQCIALPGNGIVRIFKFPTDYNIRKQWIKFCQEELLWRVQNHHQHPSLQCPLYPQQLQQLSPGKVWISEESVDAGQWGRTDPLHPPACIPPSCQQCMRIMCPQACDRPANNRCSHPCHRPDFRFSAIFGNQMHFAEGANPESDFTSCILSCPCNVSKCYCI